MNKLPLIDITKARTGSHQDKLDTAAEIDRACKDIGFFAIKGHGIDRSVFEDAYASLTEFFALPLAQKTKHTSDVRQCRYQVNGYNALLGESANALMGNPEGPADYVEKFSMGRAILNEKKEDALPFPENEMGDRLRANMKRYYQECTELTFTITSLCALALGLPEDYFVDKIDKADNNLRWHTYPAKSEELDNDIGVAAHRDTCCFTFVTDTRDGMEVLGKDGEWIDVKTEDVDHFVVNIGDVMMRWTNDEWVSNLHRVTLTEKARQCMVFVLYANDDTMIEAFPKFLKGGKAKYEPISYANWIDGRAAEMYGAEFSKDDPTG